MKVNNGMHRQTADAERSATRKGIPVKGGSL